MKLLAVLLLLLFAAPCYSASWTHDLYGRTVCSLTCGRGIITRAGQKRHGWYWRVESVDAGYHALVRGWAQTLAKAESEAGDVCE